MLVAPQTNYRAVVPSTAAPMRVLFPRTVAGMMRRLFLLNSGGRRQWEGWMLGRERASAWEVLSADSRWRTRCTETTRRMWGKLDALVNGNCCCLRPTTLQLPKSLSPFSLCKECALPQIINKIPPSRGVDLHVCSKASSDSSTVSNVLQRAAPGRGGSEPAVAKRAWCGGWKNTAPQSEGASAPQRHPSTECSA